MKGIEVPKEIAHLKNIRAFFDNTKLLEPSFKYVAWLDLMGASNIMSISLSIAANHIGKIHSAALRAKQEGCGDAEIYPMVDGVYITSSNQDAILAFAKHIIRGLSVNFVLESDPFHCFMLRGAIAYGPIFEGHKMQLCNKLLEEENIYSQNVIVGPSLANAYNAERFASPFGIWIHETARMFAPEGERPITATHWHWWDSKLTQKDYDRSLASTLRAHLGAYLQWCKNHSNHLLYKAERICAHCLLMEEYFGDL